jgi:hypothetical protein
MEKAHTFFGHGRTGANPLTLLVIALLALGLAACGDTGAPANPTSAVGATPTPIAAEAPEPTTVSEPTGDAAGDWFTYHSTVGFSVDMPAQPQVSQQSTPSELGDITVMIFQAADGDVQYTVGYNEYPIEMTEQDLDADNLLDEAMAGVGQSGEISNVERIQFQGYPGVKGEINIEDTTHVWYTAVMTKNHLYQMTVTAPEAAKGDYIDEAQRFMDSFQLQP